MSVTRLIVGVLDGLQAQNKTTMELDINKCQHVSFDMWMTLIRSNPLYKTKRTELLKDVFSIKSAINEIEAIIRFYDKEANRISEKSGLHIPREKIYLSLLKEMNVYVANVENKKFKDFITAADELFVKYKPLLIQKDIISLFKKIVSKGKTISVLSNTAFVNGAVLKTALRDYEFEKYFSFQLYSDETGLSKPGPGAFELLFQNVSRIKNIYRNEILHVGDSIIADFNGARAAGFQSLLIKK
ncbi:HAD family hydrolase [Gynurincola endophyticus]|uniref:HAD family hydrolase n=1 Tax=Gynurincola endophyticus TaxID=2479004 RepID=UPI000F8EE0A1|nr:HAD family hydrolase [Gynurincola endophyticus]